MRKIAVGVLDLMSVAFTGETIERSRRQREQIVREMGEEIKEYMFELKGILHEHKVKGFQTDGRSLSVSDSARAFIQKHRRAKELWVQIFSLMGTADGLMGASPQPGDASYQRAYEDGMKLMRKFENR